jgi:hypothetical protein
MKRQLHHRTSFYSKYPIPCKQVRKHGKMGYGGAAGVSYIQDKMGYGSAAGVSYIHSA